jgi:hypothetical protein
MIVLAVGCGDKNSGSDSASDDMNSKDTADTSSQAASEATDSGAGTGSEASDDDVPSDAVWLRVTIECPDCTSHAPLQFYGSQGMTLGMPSFLEMIEAPSFPVHLDITDPKDVSGGSIALDAAIYTFMSYQDTIAGGMGAEPSEPQATPKPIDLKAGQWNEVTLTLTVPDDTDTSTDSESELPTCADLTCGENATCEEDTDEGASCVCEKGMLGDGDVCEPSGSWIQHTIGTQDTAIYVAPALIDSDSEMDVVVTSSNHMSTYTAEIAWYSNDGDGASFTKHIVGAADDEDPIYAANGVAVGDVDKDGDMDVAVAAGPMGNGPGGVYLFAGAAEPTASPWVRRELLKAADETFFKIYFADMDGDSYLDIVAGGSKKGAILLNPGVGGGDWTVVRMNDGTGGGLYVGDMDGDDDQDVINASTAVNRVSWTEADLTDETPTFTDTFIANLTFPLDVYAMDVNDDGRMDVISSRIGGRGLRWYEQPATSGAAWPEHMIRQEFSGTDLFVGDVDGNGVDDVLVSGLAMMESDKLPPSLAWFERTVEEGGEATFETHWIDYDNPTLVIPGDNALADMNGDGRLDVVVTCLTNDAVYWYENALAD